MERLTGLGILCVGNDILWMLFAVSLHAVLVAFAHHEEVVGKRAVNLRTNARIEFFGHGNREPVHAAKRKGNDVLGTSLAERYVAVGVRAINRRSRCVTCTGFDDRL